MKLTRRDFLKLSAYTGIAVVSSGIQGCSSDDDEASDNPEAFRFDHGVASGDPWSDSVIIWTRVTPSDAGDVKVMWEVATDEAFTNLVNQDEASFGAHRDYTVKIEVQQLTAGTVYYYRFTAGTGANKLVSPVGMTKTLPTGSVNQVKMGVFSCSNYPAGYFNVYAEAAKRNDLDVVLHLGDYLYEYAREYDGSPAYASEDAAALGREVMPEGEIIQLADYRTRYAQYRTDEDLQALHGKVPFIVVWDDHEIANDAYIDGAENHDSTTEGDFETRKQAAVQAFFEWLPLRPIRPDVEGRIYRQFEFGELVNLCMLDTRLIGRDKPLAYADYMNPNTGEMDVAEFTNDVSSDQRTILGAEQRNWLVQSLSQSGAIWQVLGQQVLMTRMLLPAITLTPDPLSPTLSLAEYGVIATAALTYQALLGQGVPDTDAALKAAGMSDEQIAIIRDPVQMGYLQSPKIPYNLDAWDGYAYDREVVLGAALGAGKNLITLAGDTHNAWSGALTNAQGSPVGIEFAVASVSSPGLEDYLQIPDAATARQQEAAFPALVDDLNYTNLRERGYMVVTFTPSNAEAEWVFIDTVKSKNYQVEASLSHKISVFST
ncbi:MAG: alkaline phosphatase D family protein [Gammaproteobacteria bacterium]|nr:alkaline phosphatase D family protein [Gammaproteobacteria bacterium]